MSQVLGKLQPEDEDDDEEEDELVGLADYGDGPDSSDADPDSGAEEGANKIREKKDHQGMDTLSNLHFRFKPVCNTLLRPQMLSSLSCRPTGTPESTTSVLDFSDPFSTEVKPRILLMGLRRSGKSSIQKVVFHKMSPNETLFLESTNKICREDVSNSSFVNFQIWDFPGQIDFFDPTFDYEMIFRGTGALIFVIDSQDDYMEALARLHLTVTRAYKVNTDINFEVFIHKVDGLSDDHKIETQRDIHQRANDDLADAGLEKIHLSFYLTSIYDHSIFEAFSKVVQKLIPQLPTLENLLNIFISNSGIEKAFLFDVVSKIYIATDSTPVDMQTYELCCDMIDVVIDISCIYGLKEDGAGTPYDKESTAIIKLNNTTVLYLKEVTKFLALVCFVREESFERKGLIDYNFHCFRKAIHEVFEVRMKVVKSRKVQNRLQKKKGATPNGTPRVLL
uniref:Ras-related GTP-binding protein n=1 Tax=Equus caballus TaxID=9796 RepID=A0A9L0SHA7_HORSE